MGTSRHLADRAELASCPIYDIRDYSKAEEHSRDFFMSRALLSLGKGRS